LVIVFEVTFYHVSGLLEVIRVLMVIELVLGLVHCWQLGWHALAETILNSGLLLVIDMSRNNHVVYVDLLRLFQREVALLVGRRQFTRLHALKLGILNGHGWFGLHPGCVLGRRTSFGAKLVVYRALMEHLGQLGFNAVGGWLQVQLARDISIPFSRPD
jgi:hypothetical protein